MKRYPAYKKDNGVEWINEIPERWCVKRLKHISKIRYGLGQPPNEKEGGLPLIRATNVKAGKIVGNGMAYVDPDDVPYDRNPILKKNEIVVVRSGAYTADSAIIPDEYNGAVSGYDMVVTVQAAIPQFIGYAFLSSYVLYNQLFMKRLRAAQPHLNAEELGETYFLLPEDLDEQKKLLKFLNHKTHLIDTLIEKKQKQIELLQEQRTALINHAVTKGLNPNIRMKDSGIEWLGEVPAHWTILMLGKMAQLQRGHDLPDRLREEGSIPIVSSSGISGYHSRPKIKGPGVLTGRYGTLGKPFYIETDFWPLNTTLYVKNFHCNVPKFVFYMLHYIPFDIDAEKSAVPGVNRNTLHPLHVVRPPIEEQEEIVKYIEKRTKMVDGAIDNVQKQIEQLKEYRTTLISEVVTGKIDVRDEAIP